MPEGEDATTYIVEERSGRANYKGALLTSDMAAGQPIKRTDVVKVSERRFVSMALRPGYRGLSVSLAKDSAAGGFVYPGDIVDIAHSGKTGGRGNIIVSGVRILSIETGLDPRTQLPAGGGTATLEVTESQAQRLIAATTEGQLSIVLRPIPEQSSILEAQESGKPLEPEKPKTAQRRTAPREYVGDAGGLLIIRGINQKQ